MFLPDHWHAIFFPPHPLTISDVMESIKVGSTRRVNIPRAERGLLWQPRFFDRALRTVKEYNEKVEYIHLNPVKAGLVKRPEDWPWSSVHDYTGSVKAPAGMGGPITCRSRHVASRREDPNLRKSRRVSQTETLMA